MAYSTELFPIEVAPFFMKDLLRKEKVENYLTNFASLAFPELNPRAWPHQAIIADGRLSKFNLTI